MLFLYLPHTHCVYTWPIQAHINCVCEQFNCSVIKGWHSYLFCDAKYQSDMVGGWVKVDLPEKTPIHT